MKRPRTRAILVPIVAILAGLLAAPTAAPPSVRAVEPKALPAASAASILGTVAGSDGGSLAGGTVRACVGDAGCSGATVGDDGSLWVNTKGAERSPRKMQRRSRSAEHGSALIMNVSVQQLHSEKGIPLGWNDLITCKIA